MIGVYWGRFNPPHYGHINLIKKLLKKVNILIIAIGSSQEKNTKKNPFSGKERIELVKAFLREEKITLKKVKIILIKDGYSWKTSVESLFNTCPKFDIIFTDRKIIAKIAKKHVKISKTKRIGKTSSTILKKAIANNKKWEQLTGKSVVKLIIKFNGINRLKKCYNK